MSNTTLLGLPNIASNQSQKHVTHNDALVILDALVMAAVTSQTLTAPPGSPAEGDRYIVAATATGAWAGQEEKIADYSGGGWVFYTPKTGWLVYVAATDNMWIYNGSAWAQPTPPSEYADNLFRIYDNADPTKIAAFQASGITTATTRTYTLPNASGTLALTSDLSAYQLLSGKGVANGYASLNSLGKVPASQLDDNVEEYADLASFPGTGDEGVLYIALDTDFAYLWDDDGAVYVLQSAGTGTSNLTKMPTSGFKEPCRLVSVSNVDIATGGFITVDGKATAANYRVLLTGQTDPEDNGIYIANAGAWTRATDANTVAKMRAAVVPVYQGTTYGSSLWVTTFKQGNTLGTTAMNWFEVLRTGSAISGSAITVLDNAFTLQDNSDPTKQATFQASGITTATTRTFTLPDASGTLALLGIAQTWTLAQTFSAVSIFSLGLNLTPNAGDLAGPSNGDMWYNSTTGRFRAREAGVSKNAVPLTDYAPDTVALSDETTALTTGQKLSHRVVGARTLTAVRISVGTAPTGSTIIVDVKKNGTTIFTTKATIDASEKTSVTAAVPSVLSVTSFADDDEITWHVDQVGSTVAGLGLKGALIWA